MAVKQETGLRALPCNGTTVVGNGGVAKHYNDFGVGFCGEHS